ncbi:MAG: hypothetical protein IPI60_18250 [Saprospiraceae bacterium]|nr:hypothetical protein [Saprospiraceae bacterium]
MRKILLFIIFIALSTSFAFSQSVPQGMRYQAVARDADGKTIDNQKVSLQISLRAGEDGDILFTERHDVTTNQLGLFSITIGSGKAMLGEFGSIPWNLANIWLDIDMNEAGEKRYTNINSSQLLTVPYAFHAGTAGNFSDVDHENQKNGLQFYWSTTGNLMTTPGTHFVGTRDYKDFVFKSNNIQRMTISKDGDIDIDGSLDVGVNLAVGNNAFIGNDLRVERDASIGRDLLVERNAEIDGTLGVDGVTTLRNTAESTTKDNGSLIVEGGVGIEKNVNIGGNTEIDGTLGVDGVSTFKNTTQSTTKDNGAVVIEGGTGIEKNLYVGGNTGLGGTLDIGGVLTVANSTESTTTGNGALVVVGGAGIGKNVNIGGNTEIDGTLGIDGVTTLKNTTESTTKDNGSLVVEGGAGIEKNLNVGGNSNTTGNSTVGGTLGVNGITTFNNTTESTNKDNGSVIIEGGVGIEKNINIGGNSNVTGNSTVGGNSTVTGSSTVNGTTGLNGQVTISTNVGGGDASYDAYPLRVQGSDQGIAIKVNAGTPNSGNNFITFFDSGNSARGRVEGQTAGDLASSPEYIFETAILTAEIVAAGVNIGLSLLPNGCAGVGVVACPPEPSVVAITIAEEILAIANQAAYQTFAFANLGVTYESGSADYAEYLERRSSSESMSAGDIVSVIGGRISKQTQNGSQLLVISTNPALLGNMQASADVTRFEKVAFMGQVPVKVRGQVKIGDYIIPSGFNDGTGIGISPDQILANQYKLIVGVAWSEASADSKVSMINLAIGLNTNDVARIVEEQQNQISLLKKQFESMEARMIALESGKPANAPIIIDSKPAISQLEYLDTQMQNDLNIDQIEAAIMLLKDTYSSKGLDVNNHPGLRKLFNDATFRKDVIKNVQDNYRNTRYNLLQMEAGRN